MYRPKQLHGAQKCCVNSISIRACCLVVCLTCHRTRRAKSTFCEFLPGFPLISAHSQSEKPQSSNRLVQQLAISHPAFPNNDRVVFADRRESNRRRRLNPSERRPPLGQSQLCRRFRNRKHIKAFMGSTRYDDDDP